MGNDHCSPGRCSGFTQAHRASQGQSRRQACAWAIDTALKGKGAGSTEIVVKPVRLQPVALSRLNRARFHNHMRSSMTFLLSSTGGPAGGEAGEGCSGQRYTYIPLEKFILC